MTRASIVASSLHGSKRAVILFVLGAALGGCADGGSGGATDLGAPGACGAWSQWRCAGVAAACQAACGPYLVECGGLYGECRYGVNGAYPDYETAPLEGSGCDMCQAVAEHGDWSALVKAPDDSDGPDGDPPCVPRSCESLEYTCGATSDGCGGTLQCGVCAAPLACMEHRCGVSIEDELEVDFRFGTVQAIDALVAEADGALWVLGQTESGNDVSFVFRILPDATLDVGFNGSKGYLAFDGDEGYPNLGPYTGRPCALALAGDGGALVLTSASDGFRLARVKSSGRLDSGWGERGVNAPAMGTAWSWRCGMWRHGDGYLAAIGETIGRLHGDGEVDHGFALGFGESVRVGGAIAAETMVVEGDGSFVAAARRRTSDVRWVVQRFQADGEIDRTWAQGQGVEVAEPPTTYSNEIPLVLRARVMATCCSVRPRAPTSPCSSGWRASPRAARSTRATAKTGSPRRRSGAGARSSAPASSSRRGASSCSARTSMDRLCSAWTRRGDPTWRWAAMGAPPSRFTATMPTA